MLRRQGDGAGAGETPMLAGLAGGLIVNVGEGRCADSELIPSGGLPSVSGTDSGF